MKAKRITALMIASMFSGALAVGTTAGAADANPDLAEHFKRLDDNNNDQLEQGEFARFEAMERGMHMDETKQEKGRGLDLHESKHW